ncbi:hypothetical protein S4A8_11151 [Salinisphaera sp. S4-8]|uniref:hypothetical protein n=1 Tax=Salinisphaera sp. S4-8 TaxID=633357 RepID=UPI003342E091
MPVVLLIVLTALVLVHLYLQGAVTYLVVTDDESKLRRAAQVAVIWLVPIVGVLFVGYFKAEAYDAGDQRPPLVLVPVLWLVGGPKTANGGGDAVDSGLADPASHDFSANE